MITSVNNQKMKEVIQLQKKSRARSREKLFIAEGIRMVRETPAERLVKIYISESFAVRYGNGAWEESLGYAASEKVELVSDEVFSRISETKTPQGILAVVQQMEYCLDQMLTDPHLILLDNLQDPGNLGTIFRTAEAAGVTGIILSRDCVDIYNPKTIRSTMGALYRMPFTYADDLPTVIGILKKKDVRVYAAHLEGKNCYDQEDYRTGTAFLIGNEGNGLRREVADCADALIRIPMAGQVESLNAAIAATVLMFEVSRQRRG